MAFISNASNFTLGDGVYTNVQGNIVHNNFYGTKRRRDEIEGTRAKADHLWPIAIRSSDGSDVLLLRDRPDKRPRLEEDGATGGLKVIRQQNLQLIRQIGSGPGYLLHAARNKARAVTVKVFNSSGPTARQQLESAVTLCKKLMHPNVLRIKGISSSTSLSQFIVYEDVARKNAKGPLATALQNRTRSVQLGFKMVADLSAGLDYLSRQGISLAVMRAENFDVFLDADDRFLIIMNANSSDEGDAPHSHGSQEDNSWALFNSICDKILVSANRVLHTEESDRDFVLLPPTSPTSQKSDSSLFFIGSPSSPDQQDDAGGHASSVGDPRREYVWRVMDRGKQSLATVTEHMTTHLDLPLRLQKLTQTDGRRVHRCRGYIREEITLAPTIVDSAVVSHDAPRPLEICSICHEIVDWDEVFRCICGDSGPGSRYTVKCTSCKFWSHGDCTGNVEVEFICRFCEGSGDQAPTKSMLRPPKLAPSAWQVYFTDWIQRQQASSSRKLTVAEAAKEAGRDYANLTQAEKEPYIRRFQAAMDIRERSLNAYMHTLTPDDIKRENAFRSAQRKAGKSRKRNIKDPNAPKRPLSAYFMFLQRIRASKELVKEVFGDETETTRQSVLAAARWRGMTDEERKPFLAQAELEKMEYEAAMRLYEAYELSTNLTVVDGAAGEGFATD